MLKEILVITDSHSINEVFISDFSVKYNISFYQNEKNAIYENRNSFFDYIFIDLKFLKKLANKPLTKELFNETFLPLLRHFPEAKKIIMAERQHLQDCVFAIKCGIDSYIHYPLVAEEVQYVMELIYEQMKSDLIIEYLGETTQVQSPKILVKSDSEVMNLIIDKVKAVAQTMSTILILGESGSGKSVLAKRIHSLSNRNKSKFISVHCGSLPETLIESELFGHEKGAFTGAIRKKLGKFELANGGTIFLDEIGTLSEGTQIRLLQVLQERFIQRVGGEENISVDIRIIAATNSDLKKCVKEKTFREDLYYRLNVFQIEVPPLRKRVEDIKELALGILKKFNELYGKDIDKIDEQVLMALHKYQWPGNIRELENLMERAYVLEKSKALTIEHFPKSLFDLVTKVKNTNDSDASFNLSEKRKEALDIFESEYIQELLKKSQGILKDAATISGVSVRQLHKLVAKHEIDRKKYLKSELN